MFSFVDTILFFRPRPFRTLWEVSIDTIFAMSSLNAGILISLVKELRLDPEKLRFNIGKGVGGVAAITSVKRDATGKLAFPTGITDALLGGGAAIWLIGGMEPAI